ncbi:hypothetical protein PI125_g23288 [Phytophthora idaei]|nr:hypothetical protein PI125_g23288 [Phytophthora idaei]
MPSPFSPLKLRFPSMERVIDLPSAAIVTVAGIVVAVGSMKRLATKTGRSLDRQEIALVDASNTKAFRTSWGQLARETGGGYKQHISSFFVPKSPTTMDPARFTRSSISCATGSRYTSFRQATIMVRAPPHLP